MSKRYFLPIFYIFFRIPEHSSQLFSQHGFLLNFLNNHCVFFFFCQIRVSQALAQTNPSARVARPPQAFFCRRKRGSNPQPRKRREHVYRSAGISWVKNHCVLNKFFKFYLIIAFISIFLLFKPKITRSLSHFCFFLYKS